MQCNGGCCRHEYGVCTHCGVGSALHLVSQSVGHVPLNYVIVFPPLPTLLGALHFDAHCSAGRSARSLVWVVGGWIGTCMRLQVRVNDARSAGKSRVGDSVPSRSDVRRVDRIARAMPRHCEIHAAGRRRVAECGRGRKRKASAASTNAALDASGAARGRAEASAG